MFVQKILTDYSHYGPLHGQGLVNHLPMAQVALWKMGATEERLQAYSEAYIKRWQITPAPVGPKKITQLDDALGDELEYCNYVVYFKKVLKTQGIESLLKETLNPLSKGMASGLFHGLIRTAYALESGSLEEVTRGLSLYASVYHETRFEGKMIQAHDFKEALYTYHQQEGQHFYMEGTIEQKEQALAETLSQLYLSTGHFIVLHMITGFHALMVLKKYYREFDNVLDRYTVCVQRAIRRLPKDMYKKIVLSQAEYEWAALKQEAIEAEDAHTIKFIYTCDELNKRFPSPVFLKNANIKLQLG